jgi:acetyl-CoA acetyltransferase
MRARTAIVGVSDTIPKRREKFDDYWKLAADVSLQALDEAGMSVRDIDGIVFTQSGYPLPFLAFPTNFCQQLGIAPAWMETTPHGGHQMGSVIWRAAMGIVSGMASKVLLVAIDNRESRFTRSDVVKRIASQNTDTEFEHPFGPLFASSMALIAQRHMHEYGTTNRQMARVAVGNRKWAQMHPKAMMRDPLTVDDVLASRMITSPLHLLDICLVSDGGGAMVMVSADEARHWNKQPVYVLGFGDCAETQSITYLQDYTRTPMLRRATEQAMRMAKIEHADVDVLYPYDPCTSHVIWGLEQMGFCRLGEGGPFVAEGNLEPGGILPSNTHGGLLSYCHPGSPGGFLGLVEAVRQLRGECGARQVQGAEVALASGMGGFMAWGVNILGTQP